MIAVPDFYNIYGAITRDISRMPAVMVIKFLTFQQVVAVVMVVYILKSLKEEVFWSKMMSRN
jgi:hypothetical protein